MQKMTGLFLQHGCKKPIKFGQKTNIKKRSDIREEVLIKIYKFFVLVP